MIGEISTLPKFKPWLFVAYSFDLQYHSSKFIRSCINMAVNGPTILGCQNISFILKYFLKYCNISHQCTSDQTCFDKGRSSLSCAQSRTLHRSPMGPLPYSTWVYSITIYIKICFTCMWSFFLWEAISLNFWMFKDMNLTFNVQVYIKEPKDVPKFFYIFYSFLFFSFQNFLLVWKTGIIWFVIDLKMFTTRTWKSL